MVVRAETEARVSFLSLGMKSKKKRISMKTLDMVVGSFVKLLSMMVLVLAPVRPVMIAVGALVIFDFITGVWAAKKLGKKITSNGFKKTIIKSLVYQCTIIVAFILETYLVEGVPIVKAIAGLIGLTEGKSFFENVHKITGIDFWSEALKKIREATSVSVPDDKE